ncbi:MAG: tetratricopeptide repeat protein [Anaerolineae bacterium]
MAASTAIMEVTERYFPSQVIQRSHQLPVVVDFWAPWCGPCRVLGPTLERLAAEANGAWALVKVNVDDAPDLAAAYGVQGIPAVKAFRNGKVVAEFVGAQPEGVVRQFLAGLAPSEAEVLADQGDALEQAGKWEDAAAKYRAALAKKADLAQALVGLGRVLLEQGQPQEAVEALRRAADDPTYGAEAAALLAEANVVSQAQAAGSVEEARAKLAADPKSSEAQYNLAMALAAGGEYQEALDLLLGIVRRDRRWNDNAARRAMLNLFDLIGEENPLTREYRNKLSQALF